MADGDNDDYLAGRTADEDSIFAPLAGMVENVLGGRYQRSFNSEAISSVEWDPDTQVMTITFARTGASYDYNGVPESVVKGFDTAASPGSYYHAQIRGRF